MFVSSNATKLKISGDIKEICKSAGNSSLILILTEKCNMKCRYCCYSDKYPQNSSFSDNDMDFYTAKKSIDEFKKLCDERFDRGMMKSPQIKIYGGEPLIKFELLKQIHMYAKDIIPSAKFYITTNAVLFNSEIIKFLVDNEFNLTVSLDGYPENHDRNRIRCDGSPTFKLVLENLKKYRTYQRNFKPELKNIITINCCYDEYTDLEKSVDFFNQNYKDLEPVRVMYSAVDPFDTTYYKWCEQNYGDKLKKWICRVPMKIF